MGSRDDIFSYYPETLVIGAGLTVEIPVIPGQNAITLKWGSGGSLALVGTSTSIGSSYAVANVYLLSTSEIHNADMSGSLFLLASGSTVTCYINRYRTAGT